MCSKFIVSWKLIELTDKSIKLVGVREEFYPGRSSLVVSLFYSVDNTDCYCGINTLMLVETMSSNGTLVCIINVIPCQHRV